MDRVRRMHLGVRTPCACSWPPSLSDDMCRAVAAGGRRSAAPSRPPCHRAMASRRESPHHHSVPSETCLTTRRPSSSARSVAPLRLSPFEIRLGDCGTFHRAGPPRVIWMALAEGSAGLAAINGEMNARLAPLGFEPERRRYAAHLTMARVKDVARGSQADVRRITLDIRQSECGAVGSPTRRSSAASSPRKGARYESLASCPFLYP